MSAKHLSVYGYPQNTTPNFERFADRATVFHSNYSAANFTSPGTATLLTGMLPWKHRAFNLGGFVARNLVENNLFNLLGDDFFSMGFSQNDWANKLLSEFKSSLSSKLPPSAFSSGLMRIPLSYYLPDENYLAFNALDEYLARAHPTTNPFPGSITLGLWDSFVTHIIGQQTLSTDEFPHGKPNNNAGFYYDNKVVFAEIAQTIGNLNRAAPFLGYFHFYSPHSPYAPHKEFADIFPDIPLVKKPRHRLSSMKFSQKEMKEHRDRYDEYIANVDAEFGNLLDVLDEQGILDTSYLVLASDHGEVFERGEIGHGTALLYEPVIRTPLLISTPGQSQRVDVDSLTSNADLLPTLLQKINAQIPASLDGTLLPGLGGNENPERSIFSIEAKENSSFLPLETTTVALNKEKYKLIYYSGYERFDQQFELFNLEEDPNELTNIVDIDIITASRMKEELLTALNEANRPFRKN